MKWRDHMRIVDVVCRHLGLGREVADGLVNAVRLPDENPEYGYYYTGRRVIKKKVAHHSIEGLKLGWKHLKKARKNYLKGKSYIVELGKALHYFHDYAVDPTSGFLIFKWRSAEAHDNREIAISSLDIPLDAIAKGKEVRKINEFKKILFSARPQRDPEKILHLATFLTAAAITVLTNPEKEGYNWPRALLIHVILLAVPWILVLLQPQAFLLSALASYILHKLDFHYHKAKLERDWFKP